MKNFNRRSVLAGAAAGLGALGALGAGAADAQLVYTTRDWKVSDFDRIVDDPARIKQVYDVAPIGGGKFLNNIKNSLNGLHFGFGIPAPRIKIVAALHGPANMLNFDDYIWNKYNIGSWLKVADPVTGQPASRNPYYASKAGLHYASQDPDSPDSIYSDTSMQALQRRGVVFLSCHTATEEQARALIEHNRGNNGGNNLWSEQPETIVKEMLAHTVPDVLVVAAMVAAIALLQTDGHYSYISVS